VLCNEVLALLDRLRSNLARDISVRAQIKFRGSVIDIERIHPALSDGKGGRLAASGRPGDHDHPGLHSARRGKKATDSFSGRNVVSGSEFNRIGEARRRHRTRAACRGEALLHAPPLFIDDTEVLKLLSSLLDALAGLLELLFLEAGHFLFVVGINRGPGELYFLDLLLQSCVLFLVVLE
jgi:hypothetical protein